MVINQHGRRIITLRFVSGDNFFSRVIIYYNALIQGQYVYINTTFIIFQPCGDYLSYYIMKGYQSD